MNQNSFPDLPTLSLYRYENFLNIYTDDNGLKFYNLLRSINVFPADNTQVEDVYTVTYNDTWHLISYNYYNTMDLWWLVCAYNQVFNPVQMPASGTQLKLLKSNYVSTVLTELNNQLSK
jgi:hypothetical protein